jgi:hypothetical protein
LESFFHAPREQQAVQRALIFSQHAMRGTRRETNSHEAELACAIASDGIY